MWRVNRSMETVWNHTLEWNSFQKVSISVISKFKLLPSYLQIFRTDSDLIYSFNWDFLSQHLSVHLFSCAYFHMSSESESQFDWWITVWHGYGYKADGNEWNLIYWPDYDSFVIHLPRIRTKWKIYLFWECLFHCFKRMWELLLVEAISCYDECISLTSRQRP